MQSRFEKLGNKIYPRARNFARSWLLAYAAGVGFRYLTNYLLPNGQLAQSFSFQVDEVFRGPIGYAGLYALDRILRKYAKEQSYLLKPLAILASVAFETSQHLSPIPNSVIENLGVGINCDSTVLGSVEDVIMDMVTTLSYKSDASKKHNNAPSI